MTNLIEPTANGLKVLGPRFALNPVDAQNPVTMPKLRTIRSPPPNTVHEVAKRCTLGA